jgi:hypothetical protein
MDISASVWQDLVIMCVVCLMTTQTVSLSKEGYTPSVPKKNVIVEILGQIIKEMK